MTEWAALPEAVRQKYPWAGDFLAVDGGRMHFVDVGSGEPILFVHGNPTWSFYWRNLIAELSGSYRCVANDHLGHGLSDKPEEWTYRLSDHVANLCRLIEAKDLRNITLVVHDWGGAIGMGAAIRMPERFARLVIFNTSVFLGPVPLTIRMCRWPGVGDLTVRGINGFMRVGLIRATGDRAKFRDGVAEGYLAPYGSWADRVGIQRFVRDIPVESDHPTHREIARLTDEVPKKLGHLPTLIVWGERDFVFTNAFRDRFKAMFPQAEVVSYPQAGHWVVEDERERIGPVVRDWLARHPLPS